MWDDCEGIGRLRDGREVLRTKEGTRHAQERKMIVRRVKAGLADVPPLMYPHPELGCGGKLRFDDHRCRWPITQCAVRSMVIVVSSPRGGQHLCFLHTGDDFAV